MPLKQSLQSRITELVVEVNSLDKEIPGIEAEINKAKRRDQQDRACSLLKKRNDKVTVRIERCNALTYLYERKGDAESVQYYSARVSQDCRRLRGEL